MLREIPLNSCRAVFAKDELAFKSVAEAFDGAKFIGIMTYSISARRDSRLLGALRRACAKGTDAVIITNVPRRFKHYYGYKYALAAKDAIELYKKQLDPAQYSMRLSPYFAFGNHAKLILTDGLVYWGSGNFSDESAANLECGTLSDDPGLIKYLREELFEAARAGSVPYYRHNFAAGIINLGSLSALCRDARRELFESAFEPVSEYETGFEERWAYRRQSGLSLAFLRRFTAAFNGFEGALDDVREIAAELDEAEEEAAGLNALLGEFHRAYGDFGRTIGALFGELEAAAGYDPDAEAMRLLTADYGMEAHDEDFEHYAALAVQAAAEEYSALTAAAEPELRAALGCLDSMAACFERLEAALRSMLRPSEAIDNTGIHRVGG